MKAATILIAAGSFLCMSFGGAPAQTSKASKPMDKSNASVKFETATFALG